MRRPDPTRRIRVDTKKARGLMSTGLGNPGNDLLSRVSTIIGGNCLTTVFGMGTGMASYLSSPGIRVDPEAETS